MKKIVITLVLALCLVTAGTGAVSAADAGADDCIPANDHTDDGSGVGMEGCTVPPCAYLCDGSVES